LHYFYILFLENEPSEQLKRDINDDFINEDKLGFGFNDYKIVIITDLNGSNKKMTENEGRVFDARKIRRENKSFSPKSFNNLMLKFKKLPLRFQTRKSLNLDS